MSDVASKPVSASVIYNPGEGDPLETTWGGKKFVKGQAVTITDPHLIHLARGNPAFNVDGEDKAADAAKRSEADHEQNRKNTIAAFEAEEEALQTNHEGRRKALHAELEAEHDAFEQRRAAAMGAFSKERRKPDNAPIQPKSALLSTPATSKPASTPSATGALDPNSKPRTGVAQENGQSQPDSGAPQATTQPNGSPNPGGAPSAPPPSQPPETSPSSPPGT